MTSQDGPDVTSRSLLLQPASPCLQTYFPLFTAFIAELRFTLTGNTRCGQIIRRGGESDHIGRNLLLTPI
jgi:hypothetical protein